MNTAAICAFLAFHSTTAIVPQYEEYCKRNPSACASYEVSNEKVDMNKKTLAMLQSINSQINHTVSLQNDINVYKTQDYWTMAGKKGDCEDVALLKQRILEQKGIAKSNLIMSIVYDENGEGHVVLIVRAKQGDYAMDVKRDLVVLWNHLPYRYLMSQSPEDRNVWYNVDERCEVDVNKTITGSYGSRD